MATVEELANLVVTATEQAKSGQPNAQLADPATLTEVVQNLPAIATYAADEIAMNRKEVGQLLKLVNSHLKAQHEARTVSDGIVFPPELEPLMAMGEDFQFKPVSKSSVAKSRKQRGK